ncbi:MAG: choice-of-anchor P family protein, partial [Acidimicrobiales bacterium]
MVPCITSHRRRRRRPLAAAVPALLLAASSVTAAALGSGPAGAATADTVSGGAFGAEATLLSVPVFAAQPTVTLPATGATQTATSASLTVLTLIGTGAVNVATGATAVGTASEAVHSSATVSSITGGGALVGLTFGTLQASCTSDSGGSKGTTTVARLEATGTTVTLPATVPATTRLLATTLGALGSVVTVVLNAQTVDNATPGTTSITVGAVEIKLLKTVGGLTLGTQITVGQARCGAAGPDIGVAPTVAAVTPSSGPEAGGTTVTITGTALSNTSAVDFGSTPATTVHVVS